MPFLPSVAALRRKIKRKKKKPNLNPEKIKTTTQNRKTPQKNHKTTSQWKLTEDKEMFSNKREGSEMQNHFITWDWTEKNNFITSTNLSSSQKRVSHSPKQHGPGWPFCLPRVPSAQENTAYTSTSHRARRIQVPHKWYPRGSLSRNTTASDNSLPHSHRLCSCSWESTCYVFWGLWSGCWDNHMRGVWLSPVIW